MILISAPSSKISQLAPSYTSLLNKKYIKGESSMTIRYVEDYISKRRKSSWDVMIQPGQV